MLYLWKKVFQPYWKGKKMLIQHRKNVKIQIANLEITLNRIDEKLERYHMVMQQL